MDVKLDITDRPSIFKYYKSELGNLILNDNYARNFSIYLVADMIKPLFEF
jgi:hypothetical protein